MGEEMDLMYIDFDIAFRSVGDDPIWAEAMACVGYRGVKDEVYFDIACIAIKLWNP